jgi:CDP-diacylglycerol--glycerol-3-phosphate 3-phosphatidyltransferase
MFMGICNYLISHHYFLSSLSAFIVLIKSMMVSYTRVRSEGLGIKNKGGLMQRPEPVILTGLSALICRISSHFIGNGVKYILPSNSIEIFETITIFTLITTIMSILTNITAINRLVAAKKALDKKDINK